MGRLDGKVALIVGGGADGPPNAGETLSIGNGRATAILCAREGAAVMVGRPRPRRWPAKPPRRFVPRAAAPARLPPTSRVEDDCRRACEAAVQRLRQAQSAGQQRRDRDRRPPARNHHRAVRHDVQRQRARPVPDDEVRGARDGQGRRRRDRQCLLAGRDSHRLGPAIRDHQGGAARAHPLGRGHPRARQDPRQHDPAGVDQLLDGAPRWSATARSASRRASRCAVRARRGRSPKRSFSCFPTTLRTSPAPN